MKPTIYQINLGPRLGCVWQVNLVIRHQEYESLTARDFPTWAEAMAWLKEMYECQKVVLYASELLHHRIPPSIQDLLEASFRCPICQAPVIIRLTNGVVYACKSISSLHDSVVIFTDRHVQGRFV